MSILDSSILRSFTGEGNQLDVAGAVGVVAILTTTAVYYALTSKDKENEFPKLRGIQLYHAWNFFERRYDFVRLNFKRKLGSFSFNVLHHKVVALTGEDARRAFFSNPHFHHGEGHKILAGAAPQLSDVNARSVANQEDTVVVFNKKLNKLTSRARLEDALPTLLQDIIRKADQWGHKGESGRIDPFTEVYDLVFLLVARTTTCDSLARNDADLEKIGGLFSILQKSATPASLLLPWFPSPARRRRQAATTELFKTLYTYVEKKKRAEPTSDPIDVLIADGESSQSIARWIMLALLAGIVNTGTTSCWILINLAIHPEWKEKCKEEIRTLLSSHPGDTVSSATLYEKLAAIPLSAWEDELPILDACTRETQRIMLSKVVLRRNMGEDVKIGKQVIERGDFLAYSLGDVHLNPEYYPDPFKYDPGRWLRPDPVPNVTYPFLVWGAGRHSCTGMRLGKLLMKLVLAVFLARYEYELVDKNGKFPNPLPVSDRNDVHQARPLGATCYLDFKRVAK